MEILTPQIETYQIDFTKTEPDLVTNAKVEVLQVLSGQHQEIILPGLINGVDLVLENKYKIGNPEYESADIALLKITAGCSERYQLRKIQRKTKPQIIGHLNPDVIRKTDPVLAEIIKVDDQYYFIPRQIKTFHGNIFDANQIPFYAKIENIEGKDLLDNEKDGWRDMICRGTAICPSDREMRHGHIVYLAKSGSIIRDGHVSYIAPEANMWDKEGNLIKMNEDGHEIPLLQSRRNRFKEANITFKPNFTDESGKGGSTSFEEGYLRAKMISAFPLTWNRRSPQFHALTEKLSEDVSAQQKTRIIVYDSNNSDTMELIHHIPISFSANHTYINQKSHEAGYPEDLLMLNIVTSVYRPLLLDLDYTRHYKPGMLRSRTWFK